MVSYARCCHVVSILININIDISSIFLLSLTTVYGTVENLTSGCDFSDRTVGPIQSHIMHRRVFTPLILLCHAMLGPTQSSVTQRAATLLPLDNPSLIYSRLFCKTRSPLPCFSASSANLRARSPAEHPKALQHGLGWGGCQTLRPSCLWAISLEQEADRRVRAAPLTVIFSGCACAYVWRCLCECLWERHVAR